MTTQQTTATVTFTDGTTAVRRSKAHTYTHALVATATEHTVWVYAAEAASAVGTSAEQWYADRAAAITVGAQHVARWSRTEDNAWTALRQAQAGTTAELGYLLTYGYTLQVVATS